MPATPKGRAARPSNRMRQVFVGRNPGPTPTFNRETVLPVPRDEAFAWFERDGALVRLWPPFGGRIRQEPSNGLRPGSEAVMAVTARERSAWRHPPWPLRCHRR